MTPGAISRRTDTNNVGVSIQQDVANGIANGADAISSKPQLKRQSTQEDVSVIDDASSAITPFDSQNLLQQNDQELPFEAVGLIGRTKEIRMLRHAFSMTCLQRERRPSDSNSESSNKAPHHSGSHEPVDAATSAATDSSTESSSSVDDEMMLQSVRSSKRTLVLISGHSGSGKTALAMQVKKFVAAHNANILNATTAADTANSSSNLHHPFHGFFISGKCEISKMNAEQPYAGIKSALMDLCNQILCLPRDEEDIHAKVIMSSLNMGDKALSTSLESERARNNLSSTSHPGTPSTHSPGADQHTASALDDPRRLSALRKLLTKGLTKGEIRVLSAVIPDLPQVVYGIQHALVLGTATRGDASIASLSTCTSGRHSLARPWNDQIGYRAHGDRLKFALRRLIQIICNFCPLIFVIDDIQWADKASLDILQAWMLDTNNSSLMVIGCYRSNLLEENRILKTTLLALDESKRERSLRIIKLPIQDLELDHVKELLCCLLKPQDDIPHSNTADHSNRDDGTHDERYEAVTHFADIVHNKTGGNPFFVQRFLHSLVDDRLLQYNPSMLMPEPATTTGSTPPPSPVPATTAASTPSTPSTVSTPTWAWVWNNDEMEAKSPLTSNVIDLMKNKLHQVQDARQILPIAACLGASFSYSTICVVMRGLSIHSAHSAFVRKLFGISRFVSNSGIRKMLRTCEREGLLERSASVKVADDHAIDIDATNASSKTQSSTHSKRKARTRQPTIFNFSHDKVQEAALDMVEQEQLSELKYRVGEILLFGLSQDELDERIFMVTNLVNTRPDLIPDTNKSDRRKRVMMLNFDAGTKAVGCSAFRLALGYFRCAIGLLPPNYWDVMQEETLQVYSSAAECAFVTGDLDRSRRYCNIIVESKCDILEKIDAYHTLADIAAAEHKKDGEKSVAVQLCLSVLSQLGCSIPKPGMKRTFATISGLLKVKRAAQSLTSESIAKLPLNEHEKEDAVMSTLGKLVTLCYLTDPELIPIITVKTFQRTFKYGISEHSPIAFIFLGIITGSVMGDVKARENLGRASLEMLARLDHPTTEPAIVYTFYGMIQHWNQPMEEIKEPLMEAYRMSTACGDLEIASWSISVHIAFSFFDGTRLSQVDADCATYTKVLLDFNQTQQHHILSMSWQKIMNLRGASKHSILLIGDAFDEREDYNDGNSSMSMVWKQALDVTKAELCCFFGEYEMGAKLSVASALALAEATPGASTVPPMLFRAALTCFAASQQDAKSSRKYLKTARQCTKQLKVWNKQGHPNCPHYLTILKAEEHFLRGKHSSAIVLYVQSIQSASQRGYIHDEATANERLADCLMDYGRRDDAKSRYGESSRLYREWGALKKVEVLEAKTQNLFQ